jgi:hypothetical protein
MNNIIVMGGGGHLTLCLLIGAPFLRSFQHTEAACCFQQQHRRCAEDIATQGSTRGCVYVCAGWMSLEGVSSNAVYGTRWTSAVWRSYELSSFLGVFVYNLFRGRVLCWSSLIEESRTPFRVHVMLSVVFQSGLDFRADSCLVVIFDGHRRWCIWVVYSDFN